MGNKLFFVTFVHLDGRLHGKQVPFEAPNVAALEPEIQSFVDSRLGEGTQVTVIPSLMRGQVNYGLKGEFTITDPSDG